MLHLILAALVIVIAANVAAVIVIAGTLMRLRKGGSL
jgi:hypothetical protein